MKDEIIKCYVTILDCTQSALADKDFIELSKAMEPTQLLEKFAFRRRDKRNSAEFARIKNEKGQLEEEMDVIENENPDFGFKCIHYSVTESAGHVEITIKRKRFEVGDSIGVRTEDGTAEAPKDYGAIDT